MSSAPKVPDQVRARYQQLNNEHRSLEARIAELDGSRREHVLVVNTVKPLEADRKCWRLVGGVLIEKTAIEVLSELDQNVNGLKGLLIELQKKLEKNEMETLEIQRKYQIAGGSSEGEEAKVDTKEGTHGVLV